ncbi:MAG: copper chaperone PCu(A)C [Chloroflexi bacterium]|nr:copper chaperone PCu(A)C [Chloroflexota bacterium]
MAGCAAPTASPAPTSAPAPAAVAEPTATDIPAATPAPSAPQIQITNAWSRPALRMAAETALSIEVMPAVTATACPTPDLLSINPCEASGDPMPVCDAAGDTDAQPAMAGMESMATPAMHDMSAMTDTAAMEDEDRGKMTDMGTRGVVYLTLTNQGNAPDRLIGVESAVAAIAQLHQTTMDDAGIMRMRPVEGGLEIPAGGQVVLEPGSYHIMLMNLQQDIVLDDSFDVVLTFEISGPITVAAQVLLQ